MTTLVCTTRCAVAALICAALASGSAFAATDSTAATDTAPVFAQPAAGTPNFTGKWAITKPGGHLLTAAGG